MLYQLIAVIAERVEPIGGGGENAFKTFKRVARPAELEQRDAAPVKKLGIGGLDTKACVITDERLLESPHGMKHQAEACKAVGAAGIAPQRRLNERERGV